MTSRTAILIPARYGSTRFPGKPLCMLDNKTMIETVYDKCVSFGYDTYVLTDSIKIARLFNDNNCITDEADYQNGTERCAGAVDKLNSEYDQFINVQGDMPDVTKEMVDECIKQLSYNSYVSTVYTDMPKDMQDDPNSVKMVKANNTAYPSKALWFGRGLTGYGDWHLGVYGYKRDALKTFSSLTITDEENKEGLEQLRWLKAGINIGVGHVTFNGIEINCEEDLTKWQLMHQN